jgi:multidrug efflux pump subunit AcrA (membrane-fusion protein)
MSTSSRVRSLVCVAALAFTGAAPTASVQAVDPNRPPAPTGVDAWNVVPGRTRVDFLKPEGAWVKKGETVCVLDPSALKDELADQVIATKGAEAAYQNAKLTREVAEIAVIEYEQGVYKQNLETALGEIALARSGLKRSEDRLEWSDRMFRKGYIPLKQNISEKLAVQRARFALEQAQTRKRVLEVYTRDKTIKELKSEVEKTRSVELAKEATWELEKSKEVKLRSQIADCLVAAPADGRVRYLWPIEVGVKVREGDLLFRIIPEGRPVKLSARMTGTDGTSEI